LHREKKKRELRFLPKREEVNGRVYIEKRRRGETECAFCRHGMSFVTKALLLARQRSVGGGVE